MPGHDDKPKRTLRERIAEEEVPARQPEEPEPLIGSIGGDGEVVLVERHGTLANPAEGARWLTNADAPHLALEPSNVVASCGSCQLRRQYSRGRAVGRREIASASHSPHHRRAHLQRRK